MPNFYNAYRVCFRFRNGGGKVINWSALVEVVPGQNIFDTARDRLARAKKGRVVRMFKAVAVAV